MRVSISNSIRICSIGVRNRLRDETCQTAYGDIASLPSITIWDAAGVQSRAKYTSSNVMLSCWNSKARELFPSRRNVDAPNLSIFT